jgi:hypothetical protein
MRPATFGTASSAGLFAKYLQSACDNDHMLPDGGSDGESKKVEKGNGKIQVETFEGDVTQVTSTRDPLPTSSVLENMHTLFKVESEFKTAHHTVQMPLANVDPAQNDVDTCAFVAIGPKVSRRIYRLHAERMGTWPDIPNHEAFEEDGVKYVPIGDAKMLLASPSTTASGNDDAAKLYACKVEYVYGMSRPVSPKRPLRVGSNPIQKMDIGRDVALPSDIIKEGNYG